MGLRGLVCYKEYKAKAHSIYMNVPASPFLTLTDDDIIESQLF
jgi:hypothetical protein